MVARQLDNGAMVHDADGALFTHDTIAAELLYLESSYWKDDLHNLAKASMKSGTYERQDFKEKERAMLRAAEKCIDYAPNNTMYLLNLAECYIVVGNRSHARTIIDDVLKLEPHNAKAIAMRYQ